MNKKISEIECLLAENLRREREQRDWTRKEMARKAGVQEAVIAKTETLISFPTPKTLEQLARVLKLKPYQLFMPKADFDLILAVKNLAAKN